MGHPVPVISRISTSHFMVCFHPRNPRYCQLLRSTPEASAFQRQPQSGPLLLCTALQRDLTLSLMFKGALKSQRISEHEMQPLTAGEKDRG